MNMKVICKFNVGSDLPVSDLLEGNTKETKFEVLVDEVYMVYGVCIWRNTTHYLIIGERANLPRWYPAGLFKVIDHLLPIEWYYSYFGREHTSSLLSICGYREMVLEENHMMDLIDRDDHAVRVFLKRKGEIDSYM